MAVWWDMAHATLFIRLVLHYRESGMKSQSEKRTPHKRTWITVYPKSVSLSHNADPMRLGTQFGARNL